jgi:hypothetical protein
LTVYYNVKNEVTNTFTKTNPVWLKKGDHGDHWQYGQVFYEGGNQSVYNFVFEARAASSYFSGKFAQFLLLF